MNVPAPQWVLLSTLLLFASLQSLLGIVDASDTDNINAKAESLIYSEELRTHNKNDNSADRRYTDLTVLGFVTPWNSNGRRVAVKQASRRRLDLVSPVTWQMHPSGLAGGQDFDDKFFGDIAKTGSRMYPRILFERWTLKDFTELKQDPDPMIQRIIQMCERNNLDGIVLEIWQSLLATGALHGSRKDASLQLVKALGEGLRNQGVHTVLVLPPYTGPDPRTGLEARDFEDLQIAFNYFVIMTYDYSMPGSQPGPVAPIHWVEAAAKFFTKECNLSRKVLLGLNFYGIDFKQREKDQPPDDRHVLGHEYISLLRAHMPILRWLSEVAEHAFAYWGDGGQRLVFFPTRSSIARRVALAQELECGGVAIWELGQGLDHFFDEF